MLVRIEELVQVPPCCELLSSVVAIGVRDTVWMPTEAVGKGFAVVRVLGLRSLIRQAMDTRTQACSR